MESLLRFQLFHHQTFPINLHHYPTWGNSTGDGDGGDILGGVYVYGDNHNMVLLLVVDMVVVVVAVVVELVVVVVDCLVCMEMKSFQKQQRIASGWF